MSRLHLWLPASLSLILGLLFSSLARDYQLDDALIYARYVRNAVEGNGLVYNPGERWNALTSPFYSYLLLVLSALSSSVEAGSQILRCCSLIFAGLAGAWFLSKRNVHVLWVCVFVALLQSSHYFLSTLGMETLFFCGLLLVAICLYEEERYGLLGGVCAALLLTRGEAVFLLLILGGYHFSKQRELPRFAVFVAPALLIGTHLLFNFFYYDSVLPNTLGAKIAQGASGYWGDYLAFAKGIKMYTWYFGSSVSLLFVLAFVLSAFGCWESRDEWSSRVLFGFLVLYSGFFLALNIPFYHWYYGPIILFAYLCLVRGGAALARHGKWQRVLVGGLFIAILFTQSRYSLDAFQEEAVHPYRRIGEWLASNTTDNSKVAAIEIGAIGWYSDRYIIDILGLVSRQNARFVSDRKLSRWLDIYSPDFLVVHDPPWELEQPTVDRLKREDRIGPEAIFSRSGFLVFKIGKRETHS